VTSRTNAGLPIDHNVLAFGVSARSLRARKGPHGDRCPLDRTLSRQVLRIARAWPQVTRPHRGLGLQRAAGHPACGS
jgi:hypothetical protein